MIQNHQIHSRSGSVASEEQLSLFGEKWHWILVLKNKHGMAREKVDGNTAFQEGETKRVRWESMEEHDDLMNFNVVRPGRGET